MVRNRIKDKVIAVIMTLSLLMQMAGELAIPVYADSDHTEHFSGETASADTALPAAESFAAEGTENAPAEETAEVSAEAPRQENEPAAENARGENGLASGINALTGWLTSLFGNPANEPELPDDPAAFVLLLNSVPAHSAAIEYGQPIVCSLEGYSGREPVLFEYATEEDAAAEIWTEIENGTGFAPAPGEYRLQYGVNIHEEWTTGSDSFTVTKGTVGMPTELRWSGSRMLWNAPTASDRGGLLDGDAITGYTLTYYHNETPYVIPIGSAAVCSYNNLVNSILGEHGAGIYTFTVQATIAGDNAHYAASAVSPRSSAYIVPAVVLAGDDGVAAVTPDEAFLALPGEAEYNTKPVSAAVRDGYAFDHWSGDGVSFAAVSDAATVLTLSDDYSLSPALTVTAHTLDIVPPVITSFTPGSGFLAAEASDGQRGAASYAFSTAENADNVSAADWRSIESPAAGSVSLQHTLTDGGVYYCFVRDADGNTVRSGDGLPVTKTVLNDYAPVDTVRDLVIYRTDASELLPRPECGGYTFCGWYENPEFSGDPVTAPAHHVGGPLQLYARWERQTIELPEIPGVSKVYDGEASVLSVSLPNTGVLTYQWYKDDAPIPGADSASLSVVNTADSGSYALQVTLSDKNGTLLDSVTGKPVSVSITKRPVAVRADSLSVSYREAAPVYTCSFAEIPGEEESGLVEGEEASIARGLISCAYAAGDPAGEYPIYVSGFSAANYLITHVAGVLTVEAKKSDLSAEITDPTARYIYTGDAFTPAVTVRDGETVLTEGSDYTLSYSDNVNVGTAKVSVAFKGNYSEEIVIDLFFEIEKTSFTASVSMDGWQYGDAPAEPVISGNVSGGSVTCWYTLTAASDGTDVTDAETTNVRPTDAGTYSVYAVIAATDNYDECTTEAVSFTVTRREIELRSNSASFGYDGFPHSDHGYRVTGTFASGEGFSYITVTGTQTDVTDGVDNSVTYGLNSITKPENYIITVVPGKLIVTMVTLTVPSNAGWTAGRPGVASWIAVSKSGLTAQYELQLYVRHGDTYSGLGGPVYVTGTEWDFSDTIRTDAADETGGSYYFTIRTLATGETARNYSPSGTSEKIGELFTAIVHTIPAANVTSAEITRSGDSSYGNRAILLQGETAILRASCQHGYQLREWIPDEGMSVSRESSGSGSIYILSPGVLSGSLTNASVTAFASDIRPQISTFEAQNTSDYGVTLSFTMSDAVGLTGWCVTTSKTFPAAESGLWNEIPAATNYSGSYTVDAAGNYYVFARDSGGNVTTYYRRENGTDEEGNVVVYLIQDSIGVYSVTLEPGSAAGTARVLFKAENTSITIPHTDDCGFVNTGFSFRNWYGSTGIYEQEGSYGENKNDVLTALWTSQHFDYTVNYYYMDTQGRYPASPDSTASYNVPYGTEISVSAPSIQRTATGFMLDTSAGRDTTIEVVREGQSIAVYYARRTYTLTYSYLEPGHDTPTVISESCYYGADLSGAFLDEDKPAVSGYDFVGWSFGAAGSMPETMPAANVAATGEFVTRRCRVHYRYFTQDLDLTAYSPVGELSRDVLSFHTEQIQVNEELAEKLDGFTYYKTASSYGVPLSGDSVPDDAAADYSAAAVAWSETETYPSDITGELYVNLFYTRNTYTVTLNVWQGTVGVGTPKFTGSWSYLYGASLTSGSPSAEEMETYQLESWPHDPNYILASYSDWSTGSRPETMPAGNVTLTRQFVLQTTGAFEVEVWTEGETDNEYHVQSFTYYDNVGATVTVGSTDADTVNYNSYENNIDYYQYYSYRTVTGDEISSGTITGAAGESRALTGGSVIQGTVTDTTNGEPVTVLRIFFERQTITTTISYRMQDELGNSTLLATAKKASKWGLQRKYNVEPLAFFDSSTGGVWIESLTDLTIHAGAAPGGVGADAYDFRSNYYVISFSGSYYLDHWPSASSYATSLNSIASLSKTYLEPMGFKSNSLTVYYTKTDPDNQYYLNAGYNSANLEHGTNVYVPLTYTYDGTLYRMRIANEAYFYRDAHYVPEEGYEDYPGLGYYNNRSSDPNVEGSTGRFIYTVSDDNLKDGFSRITIGSKTYYKDADYIYIPVPDNRFYYGHRTSYSYPTDEIGYSDVTDFLTQYKLDHEDAHAQGAYVWSRGWGSTIAYGNGNLSISFHNGEAYYVYYNVSGVVCRNVGHEYAVGTRISEFGCDHGTFLDMPGFDIIWYLDPSYLQPVVPFVLNSSVTLYGRYEKETIHSFEYAYYELPNHILRNGTEYSYITETDLDVFASDSALVQQETADSTVWTYNDVRVMERRSRSSLSFEELPMDLTQYAMTGLFYDDANERNNVIGYVESEPVALRAFFRRETYVLSVDSGIPNSNPDIRNVRNDELAELAVPTRNGYAFAGWVITNEADEPLGEEYITRAADHFAVLRCPRENVKATGTWQPADYEQTFLHFYQNPSLGFDTELVAAMMAESGTPAALSLNGESISGLLYSSGGASWCDGEKTFYYSTASGTEHRLEPENLSAIVLGRTVHQEVDAVVADACISVDNYNMSYAIRRFDGEITQLSLTDTYINAYDMVLEFYYTLQTGYSVTLSHYDVQGTEPVTTMHGAGTNYYYSEIVPVSVSLSAGYDFVGWYHAENYLDGDGALRPEALITTEQSFDAVVRENSAYVAVVSANPVAEPSFNIVGIETLTYGYARSGENEVTVMASFPETADSANYVRAYQWYLVDEDGVRTAITDGGNAATYLISEGWDAGVYTLCCEVTVGRHDNGRTSSFFSENYQITVLSGEMTVGVKNYEAIYDAQPHGISLSVANITEGSEYAVYYAEHELTAETYRTEGSPSPLQYTDAGSYTVFFYIESKTQNYSDYTGSGTVLIHPKRLTLSAGSAVYSKSYDGSAEVSGSVTDPDSDLYRLAHGTGVYIIQGLVGSDAARNDIIDGKAVFNSRHTSEANVLTLSELSLVSAEDGSLNGNYYFSESYSIALSAYIERMKIGLTWNGTEQDYTAETLCPDAAVSTPLPLCDQGKLKVIVAGGQANAGSYSASARVESTDENTQPEDFSLSNSSCDFVIRPIPITVAPVSNETPLIYDGEMHYLTAFSVTEGGLLSGQSLTALCASGGITAGTHTIMAAGAHISDANGVDVTDNYTISYQTAALTIGRRPITVSNLRSADKVYDSTAAAAVNCVGAVFAAPIEGDELELRPDRISARFDDKNVGEDKTVTFTLESGALIGADADNYELDPDNSDLTALASITPAELTVKVNDTSVTYGEPCSFSVSFLGFLGDDDEGCITVSETHPIGYTVGTSPESAVPYAVTTDAGSYTAYADIGGLSASNYILTAGTGTLTVTRRALSLVSTGEMIVRAYNASDSASVDSRHYAFAPVAGDAASGLTNGDSPALSYTAKYNSPHVDEAEKVEMKTLSIDDPNYELLTVSLDIPGEITPVPLTLTAENKTVTYGAESAPEYTVRGSGFVSGEGIGTLSDELAVFSCAFDPADPANRGWRAEGYPISVTGYSDPHGNYSISYMPGLLTVNKKPVTITATVSKSPLAYGVDPIPTIGYVNSELAYHESFDTAVSGAVTFNLGGLTQCVDPDTSQSVINSVPGIYRIAPVITELSADNYTFTSVLCEVQVLKYALKMDGIRIRPRIYDGTDTVRAEQIDISAVTADGLLNIDRAFFNEHKTEVLQITARFSGSGAKDVGTDKPVSVSVSFLGYLNDRCYSNTDSQNEAAGTILPRPVLVTAADKTVLYGLPAPTFTSVLSGTTDGGGQPVAESGLAQGESVDPARIEYTTDFSIAGGVYPAVGDYTVTPRITGDSASMLLSNYAPEYRDGKLSVLQNRLAAPSVSWSGTPGLAEWTKSPDIGNVSAESYTAVLYSGGTQVSDPRAVVTVPADAARQADFAELIHELGAGSYTVSVTANASETNNTGHRNVGDSAPGVSSSLYAAEVSFVFADDTITQIGKGDTITINSAASCVMIAGESGVPLHASLRNETGYTVKSVTADNPALTPAVGTDSARSGADYTDSVSMSASLASAEPVTVTLTLTAKDAAFVMLVTPRPGGEQASVTYGYLDAERPELTAVVQPTDDSTSYTYTYQWELKYARESISYEPVESTSNTDTWRFPLGMKANGTPTYYAVRCLVTATRADNGMSCTIERPGWSNAFDYVTNVTVLRASFTAEVSIDDWTYGGSRGTPQLINISVPDNEKANNDDCVFWYKPASAADTPENWQDAIPTDAGEYQMRGVIPESANYEVFQTPAVSFTISRNKLQTPQELTMQPGEAVPYGRISWSPVPGLSENAGESPASSVSVSYQVRLYNKADNTLLREYEQTDACSMDITEDLQISRRYYYTVQAVSSNSGNCLDSDESAGFDIFMDGQILAVDTADNTAFTGSKLYDGHAVKMTALCENATSWQWYKGTTPITGETADTLEITHVAESGFYTCLIATTDGTIYTPMLNAAITARSVTMTSASGEKVYDGTALEDAAVTVTQDGFASGEGADYTVTGTVTDAGTVSNDFTYTLRDGTDAGDYTIADPVPGTLTITPRTILKDEAQYSFGTVADVIYADTDYQPTPAVTDLGLDGSVGERVLVSGTDFVYSYSDNHDAGTASVTVTGTNNYQGSVSFTFAIGKRPLAFIGETQTKTYSGALQQLTAVGVFADVSGTDADTDSGLVTGHTHNVSYQAEGTEASADPYPGTITPAAEVVISDAHGTNVTANYTVAVAAGSLTINKTDADWSVSLSNESYNYDQKPHYNTNTPTATALTGLTSYSFSFDNVSFVPRLDQLTKTDAGTYTIYVKAVNPNYSKAAFSSAALIIHRISPTLTVSDKTVVYGDAPFALGASNSSTDPDRSMQYESDNEDAVTVAADGTVTICGAGSAQITVSMPETTNYAAESKTVTVTVDPRPVVLSWSESAFIYDKSEKTITASVANKAYSDQDSDFTITYAEEGTTVHSAAAVGDYLALVTGLGNANYTLMKNASEKVDTVSAEWSITYLPTDAEATLDGTLGRSGWYVSAAVDVLAPDGFRISLTEENFADKLSYSENNVHNVQYRLQEIATGRITDIKSVSFKLDNTRPLGTITVDGSRSFTSAPSPIVYRYIFPESAEAAITATDGEGLTVGETCSGIASVEYMLVPEGSTFDPLGSWTEGTSLTIPGRTKAAVYARITDEAGNSTVINTDGLVVFDNASGTDFLFYTRSMQNDLTSTADFAGNTIRAVYDGETALTASQFGIADGKLVLRGSWLDTLTEGTHTLTVKWYPMDVTGETVGTPPADTVISLAIGLRARIVTIHKTDGEVVNAAGEPVSKTYNRQPLADAAYTIAIADSQGIELPGAGDGTVTYEYTRIADASGELITDEEPVTAAPVRAGTYQLRILIGPTEYYAAASSDYETVTIAPKTVNIVNVTAQNRAYNGTAIVTVNQSGTLDAVESGDTVGFVHPTQGTVTDIHPGTGKPVTLTDAPDSLTGADAENYVLGTVNDILVDITKADGSVLITDMDSKTYDALPVQAPNSSVTGSGEISIEYKVRDAGDDTYTAERPVHAGGYTVRVRMAGSTDYTEAEDTADFVITPRTVSIGWSGLELTYDGTVQLPEVTLGNLVGGDEAVPSVSGGAADVGEHTAAVTGLSSPDYALPVDATQSFRIRPKDVLISADDAAKSYGDPEPEFTGTVTGLISPDDLGTISYYRINPAVETLGCYTEVITAAYSANPNYSVSVSAGDFEIGPRKLILAWDIDSVEYDGRDHTIHALVQNLVMHGGVPEDVSISGYSGVTSAGAVGEYSVSVCALAGADVGNYVLDEPGHDWIILPRSLSRGGDPEQYAEGIRIRDIEPVDYIGTVYTPEPYVTDSVIGEGFKLTEGVDYTLEYVRNDRAGEAEIHITGIGSYCSTVIKRFTIRPIMISLEWSHDSFVYDSFKKEIKAKVVGTRPEDGNVYVKTYANNISFIAGRFTARALELGGEHAGNYTLENCKNVEHTWTVNRAPVTLRAVDKESALGEPMKELTYRFVSGAVAEVDSIGRVILTTAAGNKAGKYAIEIRVEDANPNYVITLEPGTYTLTEAAEKKSAESEPSAAPTPELPTVPESVELPNEARDICIWHWMMVLIDVIYLDFLLLTMRRPKDMEPSERDRRRRRSRLRRLIASAVFVILMALFLVNGGCSLELPVAILSVLLVGSLMIATYRHKFREPDEQEETPTA